LGAGLRAQKAFLPIGICLIGFTLSREESEKPRKHEAGIRLFLRIVRCAFMGEPIEYEGRTFNLQPTLVTPSDFTRRQIKRPRSEYDLLLNSLDPRFKHLARTEVYRVRRGWVAQGLKGYNGMRMRRIRVHNKIFLLPFLSKLSSVGIDTSSIPQTKTTVLSICFIPDSEASYIYLEKHLELPKMQNHGEIKWSRLNSKEKTKILDNFDLLLHICCNGIVMIKTGVLFSRKGKMENIFKNLIEGCFSGYEKDPNWKKLRPALKRRFFQLANEVPIHCDADFSPLKPDKAVRLLVQTLAKLNGDRFLKYTPLFAPLRSHESQTIQISDIIVGAFRTKIQNAESLNPFKPLPFDKRKGKSFRQRFVKAYYWIT